MYESKDILFRSGIWQNTSHKFWISQEPTLNLSKVAPRRGIKEIDAIEAKQQTG